MPGGLIRSLSISPFDELRFRFTNSNADTYKFEPTTYRIVVSAKENSMTIDNDAYCEDLRVWMKSPAIGLVEYADGPIIQRRVGKMLAETLTYIHARRAKN